MLATPAKTTPMLATNNYYQARPDRVEAKKNRPRTPKRPGPDTARRPQGLIQSHIVGRVFPFENDQPLIARMAEHHGQHFRNTPKRSIRKMRVVIVERSEHGKITVLTNKTNRSSFHLLIQ